MGAGIIFTVLRLFLPVISYFYAKIITSIMYERMNLLKEDGSDYYI
nr:MAG TPA: hypothetical protein [Caudoviricetes sp.]